MPRGDGTGPMGQGPMTGRGAGYCAGYNTPGFMNPGPGRGYWGGGRRGGWGGRGYRWYWRYQPAYAPPPAYSAPYPAYPAPQMEPKDEIKYLEDVAENLRKELDAVKKRLEELSQEK
jgi:hypothetical protein